MHRTSLKTANIKIKAANGLTTAATTIIGAVLELCKTAFKANHRSKWSTAKFEIIRKINLEK